MPRVGSSSEVIASLLSTSRTVQIKNAAHVEGIVQRMVEDGPSRLQIISDFDRTLSKGYVDGKPCPPSTGVLRSSPLMPQSFRDEVVALYKHYYPIETNHNLTAEEKIPHIIDWYEKSRAAQVAAGVIDRDFLREVVKKSSSDNSCVLRDNLATTLQIAKQASVPVLIFSGGTGDIIQLKLEELGVDLSGVRVVANFMEFDAGMGKLLGWKAPLIHPFNKNESLLYAHNASVCMYGDSELRGNVVLIGDTLSDLDMGKGVQNLETELKIGFLNDNVDELLPAYMVAFDIVLVEEDSMDPINTLLSHIVGHK